jgi:hypothetical protein
MMKTGAVALDSTALMDEVATLHTSRKTRILRRNHVLNRGRNKLLDALLQNQAYRSRIAEIRGKAYRVSMTIEEHMDAINEYLLATYPKTLKKHFSTVGARQAFINSLLEIGKRRLKELNTVDGYCEMIINDIDQTGWALKHVIDVLNNLAGKHSEI